MILGDLSDQELKRRMASGDLAVRTGPFVYQLRITLPEFVEALRLLYGHFPLDSGRLADFHVTLQPSSAVRRWLRPKCDLYIDGVTPFEPFARRTALVIFEGGMNWSIFTSSHQYFLIHAATVEKDGRALVMPGHSGSGKSTLCAALVCRGWRLLSDELAIIRPQDGKLLGTGRAISLKNEAIDTIRQFSPEAQFGPTGVSPLKGTVAHMRLPNNSAQNVDRPALASHVVLPRYEADCPTTLEPLPKARAFFQVADNAINYRTLGETGFRLLCGLVDRSTTHEMTLSNLGEAVDLLDRLHGASGAIIS